MNAPIPGSLDNLLSQLATQHNAQVLEHKKLFAARFPGTVPDAALLAPSAEYPLKSWRFDYWSAFYIRFETYLTYDSGDLMQFHGTGGGTAIGAGIYAGGAPGTNFSLSPSELIGDCSFYFSPVAIGGLVHFWRGDTSIGTLVGAGIGGIAAFGGTGTWSRQ